MVCHLLGYFGGARSRHRSSLAAPASASSRRAPLSLVQHLHRLQRVAQVSARDTDDAVRCGTRQLQALLLGNRPEDL